MIKTMKTKDILYQELKQKIINSDLEPNMPIVEDNISKEFGVSRTPLREALQRLELEDWLVKQRNGRLKVSPVSVNEVKEIFQVRSRIEGLVATEATKKATSKDVEELKRITDLITHAADTDQRSEVVRFGSEFHNYLYELSEHQTAKKLLGQLNDHINRYRRIGPTKSSDRSKSAANEHRQIFEFFASGDHENCGKSMETHINNSLNAAVNSIESYLKLTKENEE
ncbi:GntR family transcriptional regulator [Tenuibacillus multivorans]|uniref:DNA-binding transcriptional regulator, GntR family n=1 Tax=Tenuibacillus multivorans TaxID=237069 RepID=A0A1H0BN49_9BACI|nr:GntR family transcriptional regulator [Tenuibacillus multivorans]GEL77101.1 GntR family transcriptional regulator [Tenuibacillus multivorans]SDN47066.1 DNA-binding transcriptional regulator, GntR family [Tenuibacillus multivorans]